MNLTGRVQVSGPDTLHWSTDQLHALGTVGEALNGDKYRYVKAGAADLVAGNVIQSPAIVANHLALTPSAAAIGAVQIVATLGATLATANQYAEGYVQIDTTPGNGYTYRVTGHAAVAQSGVITANLDVSDAVQVALTSSSRVGFIQNKYAGVIQFPVTTATGTVAGVAITPIPTTKYGWLKTRGLCSVLIAGTPALGAQVMTPSSAAGSAVILTTTNLVVAQLVGRMAQVGVDGKNNFVDLDIQ